MKAITPMTTPRIIPVEAKPLELLIELLVASVTGTEISTCAGVGY